MSSLSQRRSRYQDWTFRFLAKSYFVCFSKEDRGRRLVREEELRQFADDIAIGRDRGDDHGGGAGGPNPPSSSTDIDSDRDEEGRTLLLRAAEKGMSKYVR